MATTLGDICNIVQGTLKGNPALVINGVAPLDSAQSGQISFLSNAKFKAQLKTTQASSLLLTADVVDDCCCDCIVVENPYLAYAQISALFDDAPRPQPEVHPKAVVGNNVVLGVGVSLAANCVIEEGAVLGDRVSIGPGSIVGAYCQVGDDSRLMGNVTLYHRVFLGERVTIHSGSVIGGDGFGFAPTKEGWQKIHQLGSVRIGNDVSIGSCTSIDRGALSDTLIADHVIIDNQVQVAHNVVIGKRTALAGCVGIAGSATIGEHCTLGGGVGVAGHLTIADNVHLTGMTLVSKSISKPGVYSSGTALSGNDVWRKNAVRFLHLDKLFRRVRDLEKQSAGE